MKRVAAGTLARGAIVLAVCANLAACESVKSLTSERRVESSEEVGNVYVSAYPALPWAKISEKLQPQHNLSTADARNIAAVTTQAQVNQFLSVFSAGLALSLPLKTATTTTNLAADGTSTTTGTSQSTTGAVPSSSETPASTITDTALAPDLSKTPAVPAGIDASTLLTAGTGVYQLAKILDNQITSAVEPKGYHAHLVTLQVNLQPHGRTLPYDAYINVSLFPGSWGATLNASRDLVNDPQALPPVIVYPLVITDAMETASIGRSLEVIRQAALQLSGIVANAGLSFGLGGGSNRLESILGSDRNSLVTLGRVSDHTVRIRLGAQAQGSSKLALMPRTHNVSLVVFTKAEDDRYIDRLSIITDTSFVDSETGVPLPRKQNRRKELAEAVTRDMDRFGFELDPACKSGADQLDGPLDLLRAVDRSDYWYVSKCLKEVAQSLPGTREEYKGAPQSILQRMQGDDKTPLQAGTGSGNIRDLYPLQEERLRRLLARLMELQVESRYSKLLVQLTPLARAELPDEAQRVFLRDDKKTSTTAVIRGGKNLKADRLGAKLLLTTDDGKQKGTLLLPTSVAVEADGSIKVTFPSLAANELKKPKAPDPAAAKKAPAKTGAKAAEPAAAAPTMVAPLPMELVLSYGNPAAATTTAAGQTATGGSQLEVQTHRLRRIFSDVSSQSGTNSTATRSAPTTATVTASVTPLKFNDLKLLEVSEKAEVNPVSTSSSHLVADSSGIARVTLLVGESDAALSVRVSGADVRQFDAKSFKAKTKSFAVAAGGPVTLTLGNLSSARPVQIETLAGESTVGAPIVLTVEPSRAKPAQ